MPVGGVGPSGGGASREEVRSWGRAREGDGHSGPSSPSLFASKPPGGGFPTTVFCATPTGPGQAGHAATTEASAREPRRPVRHTNQLSQVSYHSEGERMKHPEKMPWQEEREKMPLSSRQGGNHFKGSADAVGVSRNPVLREMEGKEMV